MSLAAQDAKIWIDENDYGMKCPGEFEIHINYGPWVERAQRGYDNQEEEYIKAVRGVLAPLGTRLEVKGGWLDGSGQIRRDPSKSVRSEEISMNGYS